ncbi:unnamed protein product [Brassica rapa subsp. narinosa]
MLLPITDEFKIIAAIFHVSNAPSSEDGCNVAGYFAWSLMDNYEFGNGYTLRFGMNWVNFTNPADRREKD